MTIVRHELRQARLSLLIWTSAVGCLLVICVLIFPEMKGQMDSIESAFSSMGSFTAAFGMDRLNFASLVGYYSIECGNVLGLGGAFFAALCASAMLSKEEKDRTAEFLLTHPVSRRRIVGEKLAAVMLQIIVLNAVVFTLSVSSMALIGEQIPWKTVCLLHIAYFLMQVEIAGICFGVSAFAYRGGIGIGLGIASLLYALNLIANVSESLKFIKYITPFGYCDGADIAVNGSLDFSRLAIGFVLFSVGIAAAFWKYTNKDIK